MKLQDVLAYGTSEGVKKEWDTRGRRGKTPADEGSDAAKEDDRATSLGYESRKDMNVVGQLYEALGHAQMASGLRASKSFGVDDKYLGRSIDNIRVHINAIEKELDDYRKSKGIKD